MNTTRLAHVVVAILNSVEVKRSGSYEVAQTRIVIVARFLLTLYITDQGRSEKTLKDGEENGSMTSHVALYGTVTTTPLET